MSWGNGIGRLAAHPTAAIIHAPSILGPSRRLADVLRKRVTAAAAVAWVWARTKSSSLEVQPPREQQDDHDDEDEAPDPGWPIPVVVVAPVGQATEDDKQQ